MAALPGAKDLLALLGAAALARLGLIGFVWNDYEVEAAPAFDALTHGYFALFLQLCPAYGGALIMRAPFALAAHGLGGGEVAVFRAVAVPCLLAGSALAVVLASSLLARGAGRGTVAIVVALCRLEPDHAAGARHRPPGGAARRRVSAGAVLAALRGRPTWAGVLLGLAVANKAWALLAVGPVLLAPPERRLWALTIAWGIALVAVPLSLLAWRRRSDPLLLLALLFSLRCVLDPGTPSTTRCPRSSRC